MSKGIENLTPNQLEYQHQLKRIKKALTKLKNQERYNIPTEALPDEIQSSVIPDRVYKKDIQRLKDIKPKQLRELALNKDVPFEYRDTVQEVLEFSDYDSMIDFFADFDYSTEPVKTYAEEPVTPLPEPPRKSHYIYDAETEQFVDTDTGEVLFDDLPQQGREIILNLMENLVSSPNTEVSNYVMDVLKDRLTTDGIDKVAKDIINNAEDVLDLSMEMHDYTTPEQLIDTAVTLLDMIDPNNSFDHRSAIANRAYNDIHRQSDYWSSLNLVKKTRRKR